jgi:two-component system, cell cycle response regulator DivK
MTQDTRIRVLIVEDNEMSRDMLSRRLERHGYTVLTAENGEDGLSSARVERPDLILMDMGLPVMDGWAATRLLKQDAATRHIPVIALSAHAMAGNREQALRAGCDEYDTKPVELSRLLGKMTALLAGRAEP